MILKVKWFGIASALFFILLSIGTVKAATDPGDPNSAASGSSGSGQSAIGDPNSADPNPSMGSSSLGQTSVSGTLEKISDSSLSLKTTDGQTKDYTIKSDKKSQIKSIGLKKGDRVVAQVEGNEVVDVTRMGTGG